MINNDILRRLRYALDISDKKVIKCFTEGGYEISPEKLQGFYKREDELGYQGLNDRIFTCFLDGFIIENRGKKENSPEEENRPKVPLNNNEILKKIRIALKLRDEDLLELLELDHLRFSKSEIGAFFRKKGHKHYKECGDQVLRSFIHGLTIKHDKRKHK